MIGGWWDRWREARAEAAVRRQLVARGIDSFDVEPVADDGLPPVDVDDPATWPADFDDGPGSGGALLGPSPQMAALAHEVPGPVREVLLLENLVHLLEECRRADVLAGKRGGFVTTARIRELLRGAS